jgi:hypothetical protein
MALNTENLRMVFAEEGKYDGFKKLTYALAHGEDIYEYDDNGVEKRVSKSVANKAIQKVFMDVCGLTEADLSSKKKRHRAEKAHATEIYAILEEEIDFKINEGFQESMFFNDFVETHNVALGDAIEFRVDKSNALFEILDYSGQNHDLTMQQLPAREYVTVKTSPKAIKIGKDIDLIILGRIDFSAWIQKIADSYVQYIQALIYNGLVSAETKLPAAYKQNGALASGVKSTFDELIEDVALANGSDVIILGTKVALKKINNLADVQWASDDQKKEMNQLGRLGSYEGTTIIEIPQRLAFGGSANPSGNNSKLVPNNKLWFMPRVEDKFVKFLDYGESEIFEVTEKFDLQDDFETYELHREMGVDVVLGGYFGTWTNP